MGQESERHLQRLADVAAGIAGGYQTRKGMLSLWRRRLEHTLMFAKADAILCALGKSEKGARTTAAWCAKRIQASDKPEQTPQLEDLRVEQSTPAQPPCTEPEQPCTDAPDDPFDALREAAELELGPGLDEEWQASLEASIMQGADLLDSPSQAG